LFSAQPELLFVQKGGASQCTTIKINYVKVPVLAKASIKLGEFTGFATGGPTLSYLMNGRTKDSEGSEDIEFDDQTNRFELGASFGAGLG
jgi:hypothetical protein